MTHFDLPHPTESDQPTWRFGTDEDGVVVAIFDSDTHEEIAVANLTYGETMTVIGHLNDAASDWLKHHQLHKEQP